MRGFLGLHLFPTGLVQFYFTFYAKAHQGKAIFCLHFTTEHIQRMRHGRVGRLGPGYVLIVTKSLYQTTYMSQSRTRKPLKPLVRKNRDNAPPTKCTGATFKVLRLIYKQRNEKNQIMLTTK